MGRILVIRGGAIGDFILTLPVLAALRGQFPRVTIEVLGYPHIARLALIGGLADAVHPIEARALAGFFGRGADLDAGTASFLDRFGLVVSYLYDPDLIFRTNVARCTQAQFIVGPHRPEAGSGLHATETFLRPLEALAVFGADPMPRLAPERVVPGDGRWLAAHPGSGSETKNWPERRWAELLRRVLEDGEQRVLLVGGEAEGDRLENLMAGLPAGRVRLARSVPLDVLAGMLRGCSLFVGHDSGITHLAAAVGLPCVVLWGPTDPRLWRPRGQRVVMLQDDTGLAGLSTDAVWEVLRGMLVRGRETT
ncbi:MAG: glycosyltransferase family 9 protein [Verrucomicrobiae bacterium]|nr:glycosyltransferase family 9 protein [Verrucomicrobiae bacterium]